MLPHSTLSVYMRLRAMHDFRNQLVKTALEWESLFGNAPSIISALSEFDVAVLVGCPVDEYSRSMQGKTSVQRGHDFSFCGARYQAR